MTKVLFIGGSGRSGSTILASLLGQLRGFVAVGELAALWKRGLLENYPCACAKLMKDCVFWSEVAGPYLDARREEIDEIVGVQRRALSQPLLRRLPLFAGSTGSFHRTAIRYSAFLGDMYRRIRIATACNVIVDSSKISAHGYAIGLIPDVELFVLHLVRDPRAVAFSKQRTKLRTPAGWKPDYMERLGTLTSARKWIRENLKCEYFWRERSNQERYMRLRYEDFVREPEKAILAIQNLVRESAATDFFVGPNAARLDVPMHQMAGNPARFQAAQLVTIRGDQEWVSKMAWRDRALTTAVTSPLLVRYGYLHS